MASQNDIIQAITKEASRLEEDCIYSSKGHYNASQIWGWVNYILGIPAVVLSALASQAGFASQPSEAGIYGAIAAVLIALVTFLNPSSKSTIHKACGDRYLKICGDVRRFRNIETQSNNNIIELKEKLEEIASIKGDLNSESPTIPRLAYFIAKLGIKHGESNYEIDTPTKYTGG